MSAEMLRNPEPAFGAVVEDGDGVQWIRAARTADDSQHWWSDRCGWVSWDDLDDVTVIREGVAE